MAWVFLKSRRRRLFEFSDPKGAPRSGNEFSVIETHYIQTQRARLVVLMPGEAGNGVLTGHLLSTRRALSTIWADLHTLN